MMSPQPTLGDGSGSSEHSTNLGFFTTSARSTLRSMRRQVRPMVLDLTIEQGCFEAVNPAFCLS